MVSTVYFFLCQLLQFSFKNCFVAENLRQAGRYAEKNSIILTPKLNATCLLRNTKLGTLYITRALLTLLIFLKA